MIMKAHQLSNESIYRKKVDVSYYKNVHSFLDFIDDEKNQHIIKYMYTTKILSTASYIPDRFVFHNILNDELDLIITCNKKLHHCRFSKKALHYILHHYKQASKLLYIVYHNGERVPLIILPEKVIAYEYEKYKYRFPWTDFTACYNFTPEFFNKYKKKIDCNKFLIYDNINPDIVHLYDIDWNHISRSIPPEDDLIDKYKKYLNWLILAPRLNWRQIQRYNDYIVDMYG